jgi:PAS domain S-box-containing protein
MMLDAVEQAVIATDPQGQILHWSRFAERLYGWTAAQVTGKNIADVLLDPSQRDEGRAVLAAVSRRERGPGEWVLRRRDGSAIPVSASSTCILDDDGEVIGIVGVSWDLTEKKRIEAELREKREQLQALSGRLLEAQETERRALARELHDDFGQTLTAIRLNLESARRGVTDDAAQQLAVGVALVDQAIEQVRSLALHLRPAMLDDLGLVAALRWLLKRQSHCAGFVARLSAGRFDARLPAAVETCVFRLAQEALTNVVRHACAKNVKLELSAGEDHVRIVVRDDGKGFDVAAARHRAERGSTLGLVSMQERVALIGGRLEIRSISNAGTTVDARVPLCAARVA